MTPRRASVAQAVGAVRELAWRSAADGRTRFVALDGRGGAGKSTLAVRLADEVPALRVVAADDLPPPPGGGRDWDWDRLSREVIEPLAAGRSARYARVDWRSGAALAPGHVEPGHTTLIEGMSVLRREFVVPWQLRIWLDGERDELRRRIEHRDPAPLLARWRDEWWGTEQAWIERDRPDLAADLVVAARPVDTDPDGESTGRAAITAD